MFNVLLRDSSYRKGFSSRVKEWPNAPGIWNEEHVIGWKKIVDAVHKAGGKIYAQLWHSTSAAISLSKSRLIIATTGRVSHPQAAEQIPSEEFMLLPRDIAARGGKFRHIEGTPGYITPRAIKDPWTLIERFKHAAINAKQAGFNGVELHGGNGCLIMQFLDTGSNKREDQWGGSVANRCRFGLEVLKVLVEVFGRNVAVKLSPAGGYNDVGMPLQETVDTYSNFISEADKMNIAYITLVRYSPKSDPVYDGVSHATKHDIVGTYRPLIKNTKVFVNSGVTPEEGDRLVRDGKTDGIFIGFDWIAHPDLVKRIEDGNPLDNKTDVAHIGPRKDELDWSRGYTDYPVAT
ncbi:unnamed protein product [Cyclocybe aegerita]|uniref:NADH:flavin oxidoreductase/NADH oxidase N-terminal domain-containing protein n=1 Tax=Cyclocybe aegerita TaxID=1973307 RepID=A0A8S0VVS5_CYCAE|nr:unnamed protein product [Cyclocybe aegerita]